MFLTHNLPALLLSRQQIDHLINLKLNQPYKHIYLFGGPTLTTLSINKISTTLQKLDIQQTGRCTQLCTSTYPTIPQLLFQCKSVHQCIAKDKPILFHIFGFSTLNNAFKNEDKTQEIHDAILARTYAHVQYTAYALGKFI